MVTGSCGGGTWLVGAVAVDPRHAQPAQALVALSGQVGQGQGAILPSTGRTGSGDVSDQRGGKTGLFTKVSRERLE